MYTTQHKVGGIAESLQTFIKIRDNKRVYQWDIYGCFFSYFRLLCKGTKHQGQLDDGGRQCVCVALCFLALPTPKTASDVDINLQLGTDLYHSVCLHGGYMLVNELPSIINVGNTNFKLNPKDPKCGLVSQSTDNMEALSFSLESAIRDSLEDSTMFFLTLGNSPGSTIGIKFNGEEYFISDSHSRDNDGRCSVDGNAVILRVPSLQLLLEYIRSMCHSISTTELQYELTPVQITLKERTYIEKAMTLDIPEAQQPTQVESPSGTIETSIAEKACIISSSKEISVQQPDIRNVHCISATDETRNSLIMNREPDVSFKFPAKSYKDKRKSSGHMNRFCCREWFRKFDFIAYSKEDDALYCLACCLFTDTSHRKSKKLITEGYRNWKDAVTDLKLHSTNEYHLASMARLRAFTQTYKTPAKRIDASLTNAAEVMVKKNRQILISIVKSLEFCGRQGIALRGHRDDDTEKGSSFNKGNFKALLKFRVDSGDELMAKHMNECAKHSTYVSKTSQNELLWCVKKIIQDKIIAEIKEQKFGAYYGIQCDEVSDSSNWEQLGIVLRYTVNNKPIERLIEFVACESITGTAICDNIIKCLTDVGLDTQMCRSQTMDGAGNMSGKYNGCAAKFTQHSPRAIYHYCSSHDLNLVLCKSCQVKEIHIMLDGLKRLGIFYKYSPKRTRRLERAIHEVNAQRGTRDHINKSKFKIFCETRWVEKITTLQAFNDMYEPILNCLEAICLLEREWDNKAVTESHGLLKLITDPTFIVCFQTVLHFFGYVSGLSRKLQGSELDIIQGYNLVQNVKETVYAARSDHNDFENVYSKCEIMGNVANITSLEPPRRCGRQIHRNNVPAETSKQYFERSVYLPFLDSLMQQFAMRFDGLAKKAVSAMRLMPTHLNQLDSQSANDVLEYYKDDLPMSNTFDQELALWRRLWNTQSDKPQHLAATLQDSRSCPLMYPNITKILNLLLLTSVTSSGVERANSSLKFIKTASRSTMGEDRFNALILLYVHKDIPIDAESVVDMFARKHARRMLLGNPLAD